MGSSIFGKLLCAYAHVCLFVCVLPAGQAQRAPANSQGAALRQTLQWEHNGKVFSILSHGSQYQPARRRGAAAEHENEQARGVTIIRDGDATGAQAAAQTGSAAGARAAGLSWLLPAVPRRRGPERRTDRRQEDSGSPPPPRHEDRMVGDDPYDPYKSSDGDEQYYNHYDVYERPRARGRPGYGTRNHQYGKRARSGSGKFKENGSREL